MKKQLLFFLLVLGLGGLAYAQSGCTDNTANNYDSLATIDDGSCQYDTVTQVYGCTDTSANNYDMMATVDNGSCQYDTVTQVYGCTDTSANNYDMMATVDNGSCHYDTVTQVYGCTDTSANNYDMMATVDNGSCQYDTVTQVYGCTDVSSENYNPLATFSDGSCVYDSLPVKFGCTDHRATNFDPQATVNDGSCQIKDSSSNNVVIGDVLGCTDQFASNYSVTATIDNGSCLFTQEHLDTAMTINGCLDAASLTYNSKATAHKPAMCIYSQDTVQSKIVITNQVLDTADVKEANCEIDYTILIDSATISSSTIAGNDLDVVWEIWQRGTSFTSSVTYRDVIVSGDLLLYLTIECTTGGLKVKKSGTDSRTIRAVAKKSTITGVNAYEISQIVVYPNPVSGNELTVNTGSLSVDYVVITDMAGSVVLSTELLGSQVDVNSLQSGTYVLTLYNKGEKLKSELIVK